MRTDGKRGTASVSLVLNYPPASIGMRKAGRGYRLSDFSPSLPFRLYCLLATLFPYFSGMVMGYSVATVMYLP